MVITEIPFLKEGKTFNMNRLLPARTAKHSGLAERIKTELLDIIARYCSGSERLITAFVFITGEEPETGLNEPGNGKKKEGRRHILRSNNEMAGFNRDNCLYGALEKPVIPQEIYDFIKDSNNKEEYPNLNEHNVNLTRREKEVIKHIMVGRTNKQIAFILEISEQTTKCHVSSILHKLHARDRAHAVSLALCQGLFENESPRSNFLETF